MSDRCCDRCVYVGRVHNGDPGELICVNCPVAPGEPVRVQAGSVCENFRARGDRVSSCARTLVLPVPPNDRICYIPLTKNQFAMVDAADYRELSQYKWRVSGSPGRYYTTRYCRKSKKTVYMHREIMPPPPGMVTDHINGYRLDNRRENLRNCTQRENVWNSRGHGASSGFKGVWYRKKRGQYEAGVPIDGKEVYLGWFDDPVEAARVRDRKAAEVYGPYAYINLPEDMGARVVAPDPNHPERPLRITGPYGYLRCPPYLPRLPDGSEQTGPGLTGLSRLMRRVAWALDHPATPGKESQSPEPPAKAAQAEGHPEAQPGPA